MLLTHYKWEFQRLINEYYEYYETDQDKFFALAKMENPFKIQPNNAIDASEDCKICFSADTTEVSTMKLLSL